MPGITPIYRHCEERSDAAISSASSDLSPQGDVPMLYEEIASEWKGLAMTIKGLILASAGRVFKVLDSGLRSNDNIETL